MQRRLDRSASLVLLVLLAGPLAACGGPDEFNPRPQPYREWEPRPMRDPSMSVRPSRDPSSDNGDWTDDQMRDARPMPLGQDDGRRCDEGGGGDPNCAPPRRRSGNQSSPEGAGESSVR